MLARADSSSAQLSDAELLRASHEREAMEELIRRFAPMVYAAARRQVRDADLAEDVMQNVFVTFARRAREIRSAAALGTWLLQTTRYTSANAMKNELRRRIHEQNAGMARPEAAMEEENQWNEIYPLLDEAMSRLGAADQTAVVLRFLRGLSLREVGAATGTTEEGARKRVSRAIERLRKQLARLGARAPGGGAAALGAMLAARAIEPAPAGAMVQAMSAATAAGASAASLSGGAIVFGGLAMTAGTKIAAAVAFVLVLIVGTAGTIYLAGVGMRASDKATIALPPMTATPVGIAAAAANGTTWKMRFTAAYSVAPGQSVKCMAPPFIKERHDWYAANVNPQQVSAIASPNQITFMQDADGSLHFQLLFGNDDLRWIALDVAGLRAWQIAGDETLLKRKISGDWVYRANANPDDILTGLAAEASQRLNRPVHIMHNRVERAVVVVSGQMKPEMLKNNAPQVKLALTAQQIQANLAYDNGNLKSKRGGFDYFLDDLSAATDTPFIDECMPKIKHMISYGSYGAAPVDDPAAVAGGLAPNPQLLISLADQTGLSFMEQLRTVDIWTVSSNP